jgi:hypothetical protein
MYKPYDALAVIALAFAIAFILLMLFPQVACPQGTIGLLSDKGWICYGGKEN